MLPVTAAVIAVAAANTAPAPHAERLSQVLVNGVLYDGIQFDTSPLPWRNLAVTVKSDVLQQWVALPPAEKSRYALHLIDAYRAGLKWGGFIRLSMVDENKNTLDSYIWDPREAPSKK